MKDLGINPADIQPWFPHEQDAPYVRIRVPEDQTSSWIGTLRMAIRRCYVDDDLLEARSAQTGYSKATLLASRLPPLGATMAGDFGEILVFLYHAARQYPREVIGPKKWRMKQDSTKPAPGSDVVHFIVPEWPEATEDDCVLCSEVKTKSTDGNSSPITAAIEDCRKDRIGRLAKTLVWLKGRALMEDLGSTTLPLLDRFINATDYPSAQKRFHAVAVVCSSLVDAELATAPSELPDDHTVVVISVPALKDRYQEAFEAAAASVAAGAESA